MWDLRSRTIQAHTQGCASIAASLVATEIAQSDVLGGVAVRVILVAAFLTLEALTVAVVRVLELTVRTPARRVLRVNLYYVDAVLGGLESIEQVE